MSKTTTFSPTELNLIVSKPDYGLEAYIITGFAEGTGMTLSPAADRGTASYGMKGDTGIVISAVKAYTLEINLQTTSHSNDILYRLFKIGQENLEPLFELSIQDASGQTYLIDNDAAILTEGDYSFADTIETRTWSIVLPNPEGVVGGNGKFDAVTQAAYEGLGGTVDERWQAS